LGADEPSPPGSSPGDGWRRVGSAVAGPVLITASVLVVLHGFWLHPKLSNQHVDLLALWLPRWCYLGESLRMGLIPTWLPTQFAGVPFASDPQSGWMYLPPMALFSSMSCARALGAFITLQPVLAGLGLYLFLRNEGTGRPAATVGGLALSLGMAGSRVAISLPFAGTLAWTALGLAGVSGYLHARSTRRAIGWLALAGLSVSQIAAAHLTDGLLTGLLVIGAYVVARTASQVRRQERTLGASLGRVAVLAVATPLLSAAVIVPRLALLPRTSIGRGYEELGRLANELSGAQAPLPLATHGVGPLWGTSFARSPGGYIGALAILVLFVAFASRRWRAPAIGFGLVGLLGWALNQDRLISSPRVRSFALDHGLGELWLRAPNRFSFPVLLVVSALAGYGLQAWLDHARPMRWGPAARRVVWFVPALAIFVALPLWAGSPPAHYLILAAGLAFALPLLLAIGTGRAWLVAVLPVMVAVELAVAGLVGQSPSPLGGSAKATPASVLGSAFGTFREPGIDPAAYLTPGPIGRALIDAHDETYGRYLAFDPRYAGGRGWLTHQNRAAWPAYENGRSTLFGIDEVQGPDSPVQVDRYWQLVRALGPRPVYYNTSVIQTITPQVLGLFGIEFVIGPTSLGMPVEGAQPVGAEGRYTLFRVPDPIPRASVVHGVRVVAPDRALRAVLQDDFDPRTTVVVEAERGGEALQRQPGSEPAAYRERNPQHVVVNVSTADGGILVVRNPYDRNWKASIDGKPSTVLPVDYVMQGVEVPAGEHTVELTYHDAAIGYGLIVSAVAWAALLAAYMLARGREKRRRVPG
jgi:hypothetical protein